MKHKIGTLFKAYYNEKWKKDTWYCISIKERTYQVVNSFDRQTEEANGQINEFYNNGHYPIYTDIFV